MMKKCFSHIVVVSIVAVFLFGGVSTPSAAPSGDGIQWVSYAKGLEISGRENKKLFVFFTTNGCHYCQKMEKETFQDSAVIAYINKNFIPVSVDVDRQPNISAKYGVFMFPTIGFISGKEQRLASRPGFLPSAEMMKILRYIGSDSYLTMSFKAFVKGK